MEEKKVRVATLIRAIIMIATFLLTLFSIILVNKKTPLFVLLAVDIFLLIAMLFDYIRCLDRQSALLATIERKDSSLSANLQCMRDSEVRYSKESKELKAEVESLRFWQQTALVINPDLENMISPKKQAENIDAKIWDALQLDDSPKSFGKIRNLLRDYEALPSIVKAEITADIYELRQKYTDMTAI